MFSEVTDQKECSDLFEIVRRPRSDHREGSLKITAR